MTRIREIRDAIGRRSSAATAAPAAEHRRVGKRRARDGTPEASRRGAVSRDRSRRIARGAGASSNAELDGCRARRR